MDNGWFFLSTQHLNDMGNFIFTQGLPIFYAIYDAFFHTTFPTSNGLYTTFPTSKIVVNFCQTTTYCGRFPRKSDPTDLSIRTIGKENPGKPKFSGEKRTFLALGELRRATGGFEAVLKFFDCRFSLIFRAFLPFRFSVVLFLNHKNRCFFNQKPSDVAHHLPPQKAPLVYCTSLLHRCP